MRTANARKAPGRFGIHIFEFEGIKFRSKAEARRYQELLLLEHAQQISGLVRQPVFKFPFGVKYIGDFQYQEGGKLVVEDVKGYETPEFKIKKKAFLHYFPEIDLRVIK